jgi:hypothetical protein
MRPTAIFFVHISTINRSGEGGKGGLNESEARICFTRGATPL